MSRAGAAAKRAAAPAPSTAKPPPARGRRSVAQPDALAVQVGRTLDLEVSGVERLVSARAARDLLDRAEAVAWAAARTEGASWADLADATGISRSGAQMRCQALGEKFASKRRAPRPKPSEGR